MAPILNLPEAISQSKDVPLPASVHPHVRGVIAGRKQWSKGSNAS